MAACCATSTRAATSRLVSSGLLAGFCRRLQRPEPAEHNARRESAREAVDALKHPALPRPPEPDRLRCGTEHERHGRDRRDDSEDLEERRAILETRDAGDVRSEHRDDDEEQEVLHEW